MAALPQSAEILRNKQGAVFRISHAESPYQPAGFVPANPTSLAGWYLQQFGNVFEVRADWLTTLTGTDDDDREIIAASGLAVPTVKNARNTTVVSYGQTYGSLPVFEAGVAVRMRRDLSAVISAHSTLHLDLQLDAEAIRSVKGEGAELEDSRLQELLGSPKSKPTSQTVRLAIYRCETKSRFDPAANEEGQPPSSPRLELPDFPDSIVNGRHYIVREVLFSLEIPDWGELEWRALIEVETNAVLYVRAFVESCTGSVFRDDPITISGDVTDDPCAGAAKLDPLAEVVNLNGLTPGNPQSLSGEYVEIVDTNAPPSPPPTAPLPACEFLFSATSDEFAAVNAYHHMDALYRMVDEMGFVNYFAGTTFPIPMDHRGENGAVNAHHHGSGSGTTKYRFGLCQFGCPVGIACDRRIVIHEFGHSVLRNQIDSGVFPFAHGVGDTMAVIMSDPNSLVPDRFDTFPFNTINRRHNRAVSDGWGWGGAKDTGSYSSTQILSTTLFRAYRSLGGDASESDDREFAARFVTYVILAAVEIETPLTKPTSPEDFAEDLIEADLTTTTFSGHPGGAFHKVIRWAFEKQDAYKGMPPEVDLYIDDGRNGEYAWLEDFTNITDIWIRHEPDGVASHQDPLVGTPAFVYVKLQNRGTQAATDVKVKAFMGPESGKAVWPDQFTPLPTPELAAADVAPGGDQVVGPFEWTPPETSTGVSILMSASSPKDKSNIDTVSGALETRRLVPHDNNISQLDVKVLRYPVQYSVKFVCGTSCATSCGGGGPVAAGAYFTAINIHNPTDEKVRFRKHVSVALPGERAGHVSHFTFNTLGPYESLEIDCADIMNRVGLPEGCFLKGFVVIQCAVELDVVAVYSAAGADKHVETLDIEYILPRVAPPEIPPPLPPRLLPDLIPLPAFPPPRPDSPGKLPQNFCLSTTGGNRADVVRIIVKNQGAGDAPKSVTQIAFGNNPPTLINTDPILAGQQVTIDVSIPRGCFVGELPCSFDITVNATSAFEESNTANNKTSGFCPGVAQ